MLCRYYNANGYCFYGDQCQFVHAKPPSNDVRTGMVIRKTFFIVSHVFDLKQISSFACFPLVAAQRNLL